MTEGKVNGKSALGCGEASGQGYRRGEVGAEKFQPFNTSFWKVPIGREQDSWYSHLLGL